MDVRGKLVEIIQNSVGGCARHWAEVIADGLIAHGVTVQEWISVKDRLPESGEQALCFTKRGKFWVAVWDDVGDHLWSDGEIWCSNGYVTQWMPLPPAPKGE